MIFLLLWAGSSRPWFQGYGVANIASNAPVMPQTLFYTGSTTKSFVAAAYSIIVSEPSKYGGVDWKTPISQITPAEFVLADEWATNHVTVEDALSHRTGYAACDKSYGKPGTDTKDMIRLLRHLPMTAEPRIEWRYNNIMYTAVSHAIEELTSTPLGDFLRQRVWNPLDMASTFFSLDDALNHIKSANKTQIQMATGYRWIPGDEYACRALTDISGDGRFIAEAHMDLSRVSGAGAMISTVLDYAKYLNCMLRQCEPIPLSGHHALRQPRSLIRPDQIPTVSPQPSIRTGHPSYSLGWFHEVYTPRGARTHPSTGTIPPNAAIEMFYHAGGLHGFGAEMRFIPQLDLGIVVFGNAFPAAYHIGQMLVYEMVDPLLGVELDSPGRFDWKREYVAREEAHIQSLDQSAVEKRFFDDLRGSAPHGGDDGSTTTQPPPLQAPLQHHAGMYSNPGYGEVIVSLRNGKSRSLITNMTGEEEQEEEKQESFLHLTTSSSRTWPWFAHLTHLAGECFIASFYTPHPPSVSPSTSYPDRERGQEGTAQGEEAANSTLERRCRAGFAYENEDEMGGEGEKEKKKKEEERVKWLGVEIEEELVEVMESKYRHGQIRGSGSGSGNQREGCGWDWDDHVKKGMVWFERVD